MRLRQIALVHLHPRDVGGAILSLDVPVSDGRGEGVSGIDVRVADAGALRDAARERGLMADDGALQICGTRIRLV